MGRDKKSSKIFSDKRRQLISILKKMEQQYGRDIFRSSMRKYLELARSEENLKKNIARMEKDLSELKLKK